MTNCYNCGHTGTFVLLVQFALAVPDADALDSNRADADRGDSGPSDSDRARSESLGDCRSDRIDGEAADAGGLSLAVQCPACDSTDVGVSAEDLLARYRSRTTS
ncbi:hypothetical protein [Halorussus ruber]|uniref:hypothetical protein n=1 Tax=Halorussus ruber TaxID=1126238 RepID=UPI001092083C|nr:hypothetical protein [Halorussus ruber]